MSIHRLPSGKYQADYYERDEHGKLNRNDRPKKSFDTKQEAKDWEYVQKKRRDSKAKKDHLELLAPPEYRKITDLVSFYKRQSDYKECRPSTRARYDRYIAQFLQWCKDQSIDYAQEFTPDVVLEYKNHIYDVSKDKGRIHHLTIARMLFNFDLLRSKPAFTKNPFSTIKLPKVFRKEVRFLTDEEISVLFEHATELQYHTFGLLLETGMRNSEACNLIPERVKGEYIIIDKYKDWQPKTFKSKRKIPISDQARTHIDFFLSLNKDREYLLTTEHGKMPNDSRLLKRYYYMKKAAMKHSTLTFENTYPHSFRYTFGSHLLRAGVPIAHISDLMGHESIATTERIYASIMQSDRELAIKKGEAWKQGQKFYKSSTRKGTMGTMGNDLET